MSFEEQIMSKEKFENIFMPNGGYCVIFGHVTHSDQSCKGTYLMDYNIDGIQAFSQMTVQASCGRPLFKENCFICCFINCLLEQAL